MDWRAWDYTRRPIKSAGVRFSINENANHFFPKSLRDAPMWYTLSSTIRKRSWDLVNTFTEMAGYCISIRLRRTKFQRRQPIAICDNLCGFPHNYFFLCHSSNIFAKITILAQTLQQIIEFVINSALKESTMLSCFPQRDTHFSNSSR